jgi:capsular exopolysaccharide synthesis family protein
MMGENFDIRDYLRPLVQWWWLLAAATIIAALAAFIYTASQPAIYVSRATILVGSSIKDPNPNGTEIYLAGQLAEMYADIANRAPMRQATMDALGMPYLPYFEVRQSAGRPVIELQVYDEDPNRAFAVAQELANQIVLLGPKEELDRQDFIGQQLTKLQTSITNSEAAIAQREDELLSIDSARELAKAQTEIKALQDKMATLQRNYAELLATTQQGATNALRIFEPPNLPTAPIDSKLFTNLLVAAVMGLTLAAAGAYALEYLDNTFRESEEMRKALSVTLLGSLPTVIASDKEPERRLITLQAGQTPLLEAYRRIRTNLQFAAVDHPLQLLLITSAQSQDGKSHTAANLSIALASTDKRVVLVDADLHRPSQHRLFNLYNYFGVTTALLGKDVAMEELLQPTHVSNLSVLTSGPLPPNPAELLGSRRMQEILDALKAVADIVIIDSPPITAVVDGLVLSTQVDGVLMVVRAGKTSRDAAKRTLAALRQAKAHILGAVLFAVTNRQMDFYSLKYGYYNTAYSQTVAGVSTAVGAHAHPVGRMPRTPLHASEEVEEGGQRDDGIRQTELSRPLNGATPRPPSTVVRRRTGLPWK